VSASPTVAEEDKVKEIREAVKEEAQKLKEKIEKKAYVGIITQITDSTLTITNFRGKQRIRLTADTIIIGANKKELKIIDLAVDDKIIAMGNMAENEILEAKRVVITGVPKATALKRLIAYASISSIDLKKSILNLVPVKNLDENILIKVNANTVYSSKNSEEKIILKDLKENQKVIVIYQQLVDKSFSALLVYIF